MSGLLDRIHANLVGLNMPRALETLADVVLRLERGEIGTLEAVDALLAEELGVRENRRVGVALKTARLTPPKTLESHFSSFFEFQHQRVVIELVGCSYALCEFAD